MAKAYAFFSDEMLTDYFCEGSIGTNRVGDHDGDDVDPHNHWSILTIEDGEVIDLDWGYHSKEEAAITLSKQEAYEGSIKLAG